MWQKTIKQKMREALVEKECCALMLSEKELDTGFETVFKDLFSSEVEQKKLSENIKKLALPRATEDIVDEIEKLLNTRN